MLAASNRKDQDFSQLKEKNVWEALYVFNNGEKLNRVSLHCRLFQARDACNNTPQGSEAKYNFASETLIICLV